MKLPNFLSSNDFVRIKRAMGIPHDKLGRIRALEVRRVGVSWEEIRQLDGEGLEVEKHEVIPLPDGTLSYKDRRILLYIRDVSQYGGSYKEPKFHISDCAVLKKMREHRRFGRYVIASREDGLFQLNYVDSGRREDKHLDVCQNCLDKLKYKGFELAMRPGTRREAVHKFSIQEFFESYPKNLHHSMPLYTDWTAPTNDYTDDFAEISIAYREKANWTCENIECGIRLADSELRRYLEVHHINGQKNENQHENLKALCIRCHALQPFHGHVSASLRYKQFLPIWEQWRRSHARR